MSQVLNQWLSSLGLAPRPTQQRIFISYRRRDSSGYAGRVADRLVKEFGDQQCFRDVEDIESGTDFVQAIENAVGSCEVLIVVIGPDWLHIKDAAGKRRLDDPRDFVRLEIETALQRDVRVIPVLVGGADMPSPEQLPPSINRLAYRQATEISDTRWDYDVGRVVATLEGMGIPRANAKVARPAPNYRKRMVMAVVGVVLLVSGAIFGAATVVSSLQQANNAGGTLPLYTPDKTANINTQSLTNEPASVKGSGSVAAPSAKAPAAPASQTGSASSEGARIVQVLDEADRVAGEALRTHDTSQLTQYFTGIALSEQLTAVQLLTAAGAHVHVTPYNRQVLNLQISGDQAMVEQNYDYEMEFRNPQEQCLQRVARYTSHQVITLVRQGGRWLVAHENMLTESAPQPCY
jgi:hypothetical protein